MLKGTNRGAAWVWIQLWQHLGKIASLWASVSTSVRPRVEPALGAGRRLRFSHCSGSAWEIRGKRLGWVGKDQIKAGHTWKCFHSQILGGFFGKVLKKTLLLKIEFKGIPG